ncbi:MAG: lipid II flippase MurJ [Candidatus Taylorbacteria bacterium]
MVSKILKLLNREIHGLHEAAFLLGGFAFLSQLLALVRDRLLAHHFGAGSSLDIYYASFRIPDFIFVTVGSLVSVSVLVPFLIEKMNKEGDGGKKFVNSIFSFFSLFVIGTSALLFFLIPYLAPILFPGITDHKALLDLITFTRILLVSPIFLGLSNFFASLTQVYKRFLAYALSPLFYNLGIIAGIVFFAPRWGIQGVIFGVVVGSFLHFALQVLVIFREGIFPKFTFAIDWSQIKKVVLISFPRTLTLSSMQISLLFLVAFASLMGEGSIAIFNLSFNLQSVPLSIIGVSYSLAAFPTLSRLYTNGETDKFLKQIIIAGRHIIFWSIPVAVLFIVLRAQIVRTILGSGEFNWTDTKLTAAAFAIFSLSALAQSLSLLFVRGYYSASQTKKPLFINLFSAGLVVAFSFFFMEMYRDFESVRNFIESILKVQSLSGTIVLMLPLGFAMGSIANALILWLYFKRDFNLKSGALLKTFFQSLSASLVMGAVSYYFLNIFDNVLNLETLPGIFLQGFFSGIIGIIVGCLVLKLMKNEEISVIWSTLHKKIWKSEIIPAETRL